VSKSVKSPHTRSDPRLSDLVLKDTQSQRYVRRDELGRFKEVVDVGRSLSQDVRKSAKTKVNKGQGDRGDAA